MLVIVHYTLAFTKQQKRKENLNRLLVGYITKKTYRNKTPMFNNLR